MQNGGKSWFRAGAGSKSKEFYLEGEEDPFTVGDSVYIVTDDKILQPGYLMEDVGDAANLCISCGLGPSRKEPLLECGKCMQASHLSCLSELDEVPQVNIYLCFY